MIPFKFPTGEAHCRLDGSGTLLCPPMQPNLNDWLMGVLLVVIFDRGGQMPLAVGPLAAAFAKPASIVGPTQELGWDLFQNQNEQLQWAGIILTVSMVGAMTISRRQVLLNVTTPKPAGQKPEVISTLATPVDDNPHSIPVTGTDNPRQKAYPQT